jgi:hypothetical protein
MRYISGGLRGETRFISVSALLAVAIALAVFVPVAVHGTSSATGSNTSVMAWDSTDAKAGSLTRYSGQNVTFYANFTNVTDGTPIIPLGGANCNVSFNTTGSWLGPFNMSYNSASGVYAYNSSFTWKGLFDFNVSCLSNATLGNEWLNVTDNFTITNSYPVINPKPLQSVTCYEDSCPAIAYNFSSNCTDADANDVLTFSRDAGTFFSCFSMDNQTGIVDLSGCDSNGEAVNNYVMSLIVTDSEDKPDIVDQTYTIIAVNDDPVIDISDCTSESPATQDVLFTCDVTASDEEDGTQAGGKLNFISNTTWFGINITTGQVSFTPSNSEVGTHSINITVNDTGGAGVSSLLSLAVNNVNDAPNITWACYNTTVLTEENTTENVIFNCTINATDIDSGETLSFYSNTSWFAMNTTPRLAYDGMGNFSTLVNFTPRDSAVGSHHINVTVNDSYVTDWMMINFTVFDVPDTPVFYGIANGTNITSYEMVWIDYPVLAFDNDTYWNSSEYINFTHNQNALFSFTYLNTTATRIFFRPDTADSGAYDTRINITDGTGNSAYIVINITIYDNNLPNAPNLTLACHDTNSTYNVSCYYNVSQNVTEPDGNTFNFTDNSSLFTINSTTGEINFTADDADVGNHSITINITDQHGATNFTIVFIEIRNVNDAPTLALQNWTAYQTILFNASLVSNVSDQDKNVSSAIFNESFVFTAFNASNASQSLMNFINMSSNGTIYLRPNQSHIGNHSINITVNDSFGVMDWQIANFTIYAYNNPPFFTYACNATRQVTENDNVTCWINATDIDSDNLTFNTNTSWFTLNTTAQPINTTNPNASTQANFTPSFSEVGNHSILVNVTDDEGEVSEVIFDFEVTGQNFDPVITWWRWISSSPVDMSSSDTGAVTAFISSENKTILFTHNSNDPDTDPLYYSWVVDGTVNATTANLTYLVPFRYSNGSVFNMTLIVDDQNGGYAQQEWNVTTLNINLPPKLYTNVTNQSWPENTIETMNISAYLRDQDADNLTFTYNLTSDCQATSCMSLSFTGTSAGYTTVFTPASNWWGVTNVSITANDSQYTATTNSFMLNVTYVPRQIQYVQVSSSGGSGSGGRMTSIASLEITTGPIQIIEPNKILRIPLLLENTGEVSLNTINLTAEADGDDIGLQLADTYYNRLAVGENASTHLTVDITDAQKDRYEIKVTAAVSSPDLNETATISLETTPINKTEVDIRIEFVKDLFEDNPECMELMELVFEAENALGDENIDRARNLTGIALENCRDLIKYGSVSGQVHARTMPLSINIQPFEVAVVFIIAIAAWFGLSRALRPARPRSRISGIATRYGQPETGQQKPKRPQ